MVWDLINREKLRRALLYLLYMAVCLLAQDSIFANFKLFGVNMFFLPAAAVAVGMFEDGVWGAVFGLALGFLADISYDYTALFVALFPILGFFAGILSRWYVNRRFFAYMLVSTAACMPPRRRIAAVCASKICRLKGLAIKSSAPKLMLRSSSASVSRLVSTMTGTAETSRSSRQIL